LKEIETKIAANMGRRLILNEAAKAQRILDPDTKGLVDKETATRVLKEAVKKCRDQEILNSTEEQSK